MAQLNKYRMSIKNVAVPVVVCHAGMDPGQRVEGVAERNERLLVNVTVTYTASAGQPIERHFNYVTLNNKLVSLRGQKISGLLEHIAEELADIAEKESSDRKLQWEEIEVTIDRPDLHELQGAVRIQLSRRKD